MNLTVNQCARVAHDIGYEYFAIQFYGECFGGRNAGTRYNKYGKSSSCWEFEKESRLGIGSHFSNFVYRIKQVCKVERFRALIFYYLCTVKSSAKITNNAKI